MKVHFRILTSFFEFIKDKKRQNEMIDIISNILNRYIKDDTKQQSKEKLEKISKVIFWNLHFRIMYHLINKIIHSLGSDKLIKIVEKVCDTENTPISFLVKHGILMWYDKSLQIDNIARKIKEDSFSETARGIMKLMIVNHCAMHSIDFKKRQQIENKLGIFSKKIMLISSKKDMNNKN
jgi:hypothetical protein